MINATMLSPSTLAFVGDAIFGLLVRKKLAETQRPIGELHRLSVGYVNANAQAKSFEIIKSELNEKEMSIYKRGRNNHVGQIPKNSSVAEYHSATGLEALFGYLYLNEQIERCDELFSIIWNEFKIEG